MTALSALLHTKIKAKKLGHAQAAKKIGISLPTFRSALSGERVPNARCVDKFAKFLGITTAAVTKAAGPKKPRGGSRTSTGTRKSRGRSRLGAGSQAASFRVHATTIARLAARLKEALQHLETLRGTSERESSRPPPIRAVAPRRGRGVRRKPKKPTKPNASGKRPTPSAKRRITKVRTVVPQFYGGGADIPPSKRDAKRANRPHKPLKPFTPKGPAAPTTPATQPDQPAPVSP